MSNTNAESPQALVDNPVHPSAAKNVLPHLTEEMRQAAAALMTEVPASIKEEEGLLNAIKQEPDEDVHRLVYADWLDEHGKPEEALLMRLRIHSSAEFNGRFTVRDSSADLVLDSSFLQKHMAKIHELVQKYPINLIMDCISPACSSSPIFTDSILAERLREITVRMLSPPDLAALLKTAECLPDLQTLSLSYGMTDPAAATAVRQATLSKLTALRIHNDLSDESLRALLSGPGLSTLCELQLSGDKSLSGFDPLREWAHAPQLRELTLGVNSGALPLQNVERLLMTGKTFWALNDLSVFVTTPWGPCWHPMALSEAFLRFFNHEPHAYPCLRRMRCEKDSHSYGKWDHIHDYPENLLRGFLSIRTPGDTPDSIREKIIHWNAERYNKRVAAMNPNR